MESDSDLTYDQKLYLIKWIPIQQQVRWARLKTLHNQHHVTMELRHFFMQREVELIRSQEKRYSKLLNEVFNGNSPTNI